MEGNVKRYLLDAIRIMMKPLVRLLIDQGVSQPEFNDAMKEVYVDVAIRHFGKGKELRINKSQIAILTGMTRKEVGAVLERAVSSGDEKRKYSRPERVLSGWFSDPRFTGPYGFPLELPYQNESPTDDSPTFVEVVKTYSGDMSAKSMLDELVRGGSVLVDNGVVRPLRRDFEPAALSRELIVRFGEIGHKFFLTAAGNIEKPSQGGGYFDRFVYSENGVTENVIKQFDGYVKKVGQEFLEDLDNWISMNEEANDPNEQRKETGVYVVHYVESSEEKTTLAELLTSLKGN